MKPNVIRLPRACFRAARLSCHLSWAFLIACIYPALEISAQRRMVQHWSLDLMKILNVRWKADGDMPAAASRGCLFVANHISWLDVLAMNAAAPARFVAKSEVSGWPLFGWLARRIGTLFIRRDIPRDTIRINRRIAKYLQQGECIALFPEGTSTNGSQQVSFQSSLLQCGIDADALIHPLAVCYHDGNGNRLDDAAFVGDMTFMQSLWNVLCNSSLHVTVTCLPAIHGAGENRRALAQKAQQAINATLDQYSAAGILSAGFAAKDSTFNQSLICPSSCGNIASLNSFPDYLGDDDAEPDPAATQAA
jgi:1-acyl-sn-glycerol-3-phosphate acyltransferase